METAFLSVTEFCHYDIPDTTPKVKPVETAIFHGFSAIVHIVQDSLLVIKGSHREQRKAMQRKKTERISVL